MPSIVGRIKACIVNDATLRTDGMYSGMIKNLDAAKQCFGTGIEA
jgi:hypothetical protein